MKRDVKFIEELKRQARERASEIKLRKKAAEEKKNIDHFSREVVFLDKLEEIVSSMPKIQVTPYKAKSKKLERCVQAIASDWHFGANLDGKENPRKYQRVEQARAAAAFFQQVVDFKRQYREQTYLELHILGDMTEGKLHDKQFAEEETHQFAASLSALVQGVAFAAANYKKVNVRCISGNHGRDKNRHHDRAMQGKWDSHDTKLYYALKLAVAHIKNVEVFLYYTPYYEYRVFGMKGMMTHGDTCINPGNPGKSINISKVSNQIKTFNEKFSDPKDKAVLFGCGHVHSASVSQMSGGEVFLTNGHMPPLDPYAQSIGIFDTKNVQQVFESVPGIMFGDHRMINVGHIHYDNKMLDKIIKPYEGFDK